MLEEENLSIILYIFHSFSASILWRNTIGMNPLCSMKESTTPLVLDISVIGTLLVMTMIRYHTYIIYVLPYKGLDVGVVIAIFQSRRNRKNLLRFVSICLFSNLYAGNVNNIKYLELIFYWLREDSLYNPFPIHCYCAFASTRA